MQDDPTPQVIAQFPEVQSMSHDEPGPQPHAFEAHSALHEALLPKHWASQLPDEHLKAQLLPLWQ